MSKYDITVSDIYDKGKSKKISLNAPNVQNAHKQGLRYTNALREEILKIMQNDRLVYTFRSGFTEE